MATTKRSLAWEYLVKRPYRIRRTKLWKILENDWIGEGTSIALGRPRRETG